MRDATIHQPPGKPPSLTRKQRRAFLSRVKAARRAVARTKERAALARARAEVKCTDQERRILAEGKIPVCSEDSTGLRKVEGEIG